MLASERLLDTLEGLTEEDFKKFKWFLSMRGSDRWRPIPVSRLEEASRINTVSRMMETYGEESAVSVAVEVLTRMNNNEAAGCLKSSYAGSGKTATPSTSSSAPAAPVASTAPATISATHGSVVIFPVISGSTGSVNISVNK